MSRFIDEYAPPEMPGFPCISSPRWSTAITQVDSGAEQANQRWEHPLYRFTLPEAVRDHTVFEAVKDHWLTMRGPAYTWPFRDPLDFASVALVRPNNVPTVSAADQQIGIGDGATTRFHLTKTYTRGSQSYTRRIHLPVVDSVLVSVAGSDPTTFSPAMTWTVSRPGGEIEFAYAPAPGQIVRAGFLFDVEVRFESDDSFDGIVRTFGVGGFADIPLIEVRPC
ncbi:MAG TPA: DUF2460 domain-containing protein [Arenicellales bacterium]|nr:DUF2460 domain-containing protein [Arenicellales bacterium]